MPADLSAWTALGDALGRHAWPAFAFVLPALMALAALAGHAAGRARQARLARHEAEPREPRPAELLPGLALGFALVLLLAWVFSRVAAGLGNGSPMGHMDDAASLAVGLHTPPAVRAAFAAFTQVGDPWPVTAGVVVVAALLWRHGHRGFAAGWVAANAGNAVLNLLLKQVFQRVRPEHDVALVSAHGYSFPSGHSSSAMVMWAMLAYLALRLLPPRWLGPAFALCAGMTFAIATSRFFLQVHYPTDILAGLCSGAAWLTVCLLSVESVRHHHRVRRHRRTLPPAA